MKMWCLNFNEEKFDVQRGCHENEHIFMEGGVLENNTEWHKGGAGGGEEGRKKAQKFNTYFF